MARSSSARWRLRLLSSGVKLVMPERRTGQRYLAMVPINITVEGSLYQKPIRLRVRDISEGGLSFETRSKIPVDSNGRVYVSCLGDLPPDASIEAHVVYRKKNYETRRYVIGIEFDRFVGVTREQLLERLEPWERRSTAKLVRSELS